MRSIRKILVPAQGQLRHFAARKWRWARCPHELYPSSEPHAGEEGVGWVLSSVWGILASLRISCISSA
jgi:hypothetical protein